MFQHLTNKRETTEDEEFDMLDLELGQLYAKNGVMYARQLAQKSIAPMQLVMETVGDDAENNSRRTGLIPECVGYFNNLIESWVGWTRYLAQEGRLMVRFQYDHPHSK